MLKGIPSVEVQEIWCDMLKEVIKHLTKYKSKKYIYFYVLGFY